MFLTFAFGQAGKLKRKFRIERLKEIHGEYDCGSQCGYHCVDALGGV